MTFLILFVSTALVFLALDSIMLTQFMVPFFIEQIGDIMVDELKPGAVVIFFIFYTAALLWLVSWPALRSGGYGKLMLNAAIFGAAAYGTYEFTNYATLKGWTWQMVVLDTAWGAVLTSVSAGSGVAITRALARKLNLAL